MTSGGCYQGLKSSLIICWTQWTIPLGTCSSLSDVSLLTHLSGNLLHKSSSQTSKYLFVHYQHFCACNKLFIDQNALNHQDLVFAIMLAGNQLIALVRMRQFLLHPLDLHLLCNLVSSSESFKQAESWTPICLPMFNSKSLHASYEY